MGPTVLLRHVLADGSWHYDWLIARSEDPGGPDDRVLIGFRMDARPDEGWEGEREATRMPDHRVAYLTYEGPLSGGRGRVERVGRGWARVVSEEADAIEVEVGFGTRTRVLRGRRHGGESGGDRWVFASKG